MDNKQYAINDIGFDSEFPEMYRYEKLDSIKLSRLYSNIILVICDNLQSEDRNLVPGLRMALKEIAEIGEI